MKTIFAISVEQDQDILLVFLIIIAIIIQSIISISVRQRKRKKRQDYYRNVYLKSVAWKRKRYVVLKRDNWRCQYCGAKATQVHHKKYLYKNIGKEPIKWLVSICKLCHNKIHS